MSLDAEKRELRALVRARMPAPGSEAFVAASVAAQQRLFRSALVTDARVIALYRALPSECGTAALAAFLEAAGKETCYPVVVPGARCLEFRRSAGVFVSGSLGVEEPTGSPVPLSTVDLLVVPAIAVDARGARLGRGKGHYDATLAACAGFPVALVFESQLVPSVPLGEHDRPVRAICTETQLLLV
ncbi:MAG: 5-formyltetrahydrofolate cyclo-ligase [Myxococcales bacterium]|nr:5-formyltetrahydrofolate cyclo-ligase [Myxococcales bacterium]